MTISQVYDKKTKTKNKQNSQAHKFATPAVLSKILIKNRRWKRERKKKRRTLSATNSERDGRGRDTCNSGQYSRSHSDSERRAIFCQLPEIDIRSCRQKGFFTTLGRVFCFARESSAKEMAAILDLNCLPILLPIRT